MATNETDEIAGESITVRLTDSMTKDIREAMKLTGVLKKSDFVRQAVVLRVQEVREASQARRALSATKTAMFARRARAKKEAA
jgi:Arc/MetJ-type ribon-helix-helix transcriptional regulator